MTGVPSLPAFPLALPWKETIKHVPLAGTTSGTWGGCTFFKVTTSLGTSGTWKILTLWHLETKRIAANRKHRQTAEDISRPFTLPAASTFFWRKLRLFTRNPKRFLFNSGFFVSIQHFKKLVVLHLVLSKVTRKKKVCSKTTTASSWACGLGSLYLSLSGLLWALKGLPLQQQLQEGLQVLKRY